MTELVEVVVVAATDVVVVSRTVDVDVEVPAIELEEVDDAGVDVEVEVEDDVLDVVATVVLVDDVVGTELDVLVLGALGAH